MAFKYFFWLFDLLDKNFLIVNVDVEHALTSVKHVVAYPLWQSNTL